MGFRGVLGMDEYKGQGMETRDGVWGQRNTPEQAGGQGRGNGDEGWRQETEDGDGVWDLQMSEPGDRNEGDGDEGWR